MTETRKIVLAVLRSLTHSLSDTPSPGETTTRGEEQSTELPRQGSGRSTQDAKEPRTHPNALSDKMTRHQMTSVNKLPTRTRHQWPITTEPVKSSAMHLIAAYCNLRLVKMC
ncbi:hypothetical protein G5I_08643 [Acromyrmex echinatior]|uniref:Uncharacterized protein n=1 Tax=Acromyrmex echinatior TaxID=103372 RepID=F4WS32_ACREC|nr:hypothetical protein G5I_08643 [Acromyrmex echinatior]